MRHAQDRTPQRGGNGHGIDTDTKDHTLGYLLAEAGLGPRRGIEDWLDWLAKKGEAGA